MCLLLAAGMCLLTACNKATTKDGAPDKCCPPAGKAGAEAAPEMSEKEAKKDKTAMCKEHNMLLNQCGICCPELIPGLQPGQGLKVRLASTNSATLAGVQTDLPTVGTLPEVIECYAEIAFNQNKLAQITTPVRGIIQEVMADLGSHVEEKQVVSKIWSASIAEAVAKAVLTHQTLDREKRLRAEKVTPEKDLEGAEAEHRAACQQLRTLGFTEQQIDDLSKKPQESVLLEVSAPFSGDIVERNAIRGVLVDSGKSLFTVADRSVMWAMLNLPETALAKVRTGQQVKLQVDSLPDHPFVGKLTWISSEVDERSRMAHARAEIPNPEGLLKSRMFAKAQIVLRNIDNALVVPSNAIQKIEGKPFLFIKLDEDLYEARVVTVGVSFDGRLEILTGLKPQERIVVNHGFPLKAQLLISRLGAGCADD